MLAVEFAAEADERRRQSSTRTRRLQIRGAAMLPPSNLRLSDVWSAERFTAALGQLLIQQGQLDAVSLERGLRLANESGGRLDTVLAQLGLVSERALAEATAKLLGLQLAKPNDYPQAALLPDRLRLKFLRKSRAIPISLDEQAIVIAMADPLDRFTISSVGIAAGRDVDIRVAVPIDLEAAFDRLYGEHKATDRSTISSLPWLFRSRTTPNASRI
jgi:general secretion pathway protein E